MPNDPGIYLMAGSPTQLPLPVSDVSVTQINNTFIFIADIPTHTTQQTNEKSFM